MPAVVRALDVLELFLDHPTLSAPEIVELLQLPRTTVHELVTTLTARAYLTPVAGQTNRYQLGIQVFQLGSAYSGRLDLISEAQQVTAEMAAACDETVHVAVRDGTDVVFVAKADTTHSVRIMSLLGRRLPAHCTAAGKVLLAALPSEVFGVHYPRAHRLAGMTQSSVISVGQLRAQLAEVDERGLAYDECESNEAIRCVAAPVRDHTGRVVAAMSISVPTLRWTDERREEWARMVRQGARTLSARLGYREPAAIVAVDVSQPTRAR